MSQHVMVNTCQLVTVQEIVCCMGMCAAVLQNFTELGAYMCFFDLGFCMQGQSLGPTKSTRRTRRD